MSRRQRAIAIVLLAVPIAVAAAGPGPPSFSVHDLDGDGYVSKGEFERFRAERRAARAAEGRRLRNAPRALSFEEIDADGDGRISEQEMIEALRRHPPPCNGGQRRGRARDRAGHNVPLFEARAAQAR